MATKKTPKVVKPAKPVKLNIKAEISKASDSVVSKLFDKKKFWEASKARFSLMQKKPSAVATAIENTTTLCRDAKIDVINILSALTGKAKDEFSMGALKPNTLFMIGTRYAPGYPLKAICLSSKDINGRGSFFSKGGDLLSSSYSPPSASTGKYSHPTYKQFTEWFNKLSTNSKIKFIEAVS